MRGMKVSPLLDEEVEAGQYGPVVLSVYHAVKIYKSSPVRVIPDADNNFPFTEDEKSVMHGVAKVYGKVSGVVLSAATQKPGTPWQLT